MAEPFGRPATSFIVRIYSELAGFSRDEGEMDGSGLTWRTAPEAAE
ncbi:hypothetical protein THTE_2198 [Thermogutta terrifontis]|uniref:Uncharacterized protein n=1 Tax=Thermogutta terrifontis TaxID=1331910 RepID=A0A286RFR7_9BACT|nr:hypothetical protein THTE_2198 [Thermogutta terrifontis]